MALHKVGAFLRSSRFIRWLQADSQPGPPGVEAINPATAPPDPLDAPNEDYDLPRDAL